MVNSVISLSDIHKKYETKNIIQSNDKNFQEKLSKAEKDNNINKIIELYKTKHENTITNMTQEKFESKLEVNIRSHENYFKKEYPLYDKYKDIFIPKYSNYSREKANSICKALHNKFPDYQILREKVTNSPTQYDKDIFHRVQQDYIAYNNYLMEKFDLEITPFGYSPKATKAYNFAVYEQLENGVDLNTARDYADDVAQIYDNGESMAFSIGVLFGRPENMDNVVDKKETPPNYSKQIDLREYGYEHNFIYHNYNAYFDDNKQGIKMRIKYDLDLYEFLTKNENIVDKKIYELQKRNPNDKWINDKNYATQLKESFNKKYNIAILANTIFEKYSDKIFNNDNQTNEINRNLSMLSNVTKSKLNKTSINKNDIHKQVLSEVLRKV